MRRIPTHPLAFALLAAVAAAAVVAGRARAGCTGCTGCQECVPACSGTWDEKKSSKPVYSMKCEYACVRGRDAWHAPPSECRCQPPCGEVIVKKKFFKTDGPEKVERVPKYEVKMVPAKPCAPAAGCGERSLCWWNPLAILHRCTSWW